MTLGIGKCIADGSKRSCPMITSVHGRRFVRSIWTIMLVKEMFFSIELWQETSLGCTIMNQTVRDNRCSESTCRLHPTKNSRHRLPLGKSRWPSFGMSLALYWCTSRKRDQLWLVLDSDMLVDELKLAIQSKCRGLLSKRVLLLHNAPIRLGIPWIHYMLWNFRCWNIHHTVQTWRHRTFTCLVQWKNICGARSLRMTR
jgi:hypothetical protein